MQTWQIKHRTAFQQGLFLERPGNFSIPKANYYQNLLIVAQFLERQFHNEKFSFVHKKKTEHFFELSLSICIFFGVFSILKYKTLVLACENIRFSSLFAAVDVSRGVPSGEERGETDLFAGYFSLENHHMMNACEFCGGGGYGWLSLD